MDQGSTSAWWQKPHQTLVAILVDRLGGRVEITDEEWVSCDLTLTHYKEDFRFVQVLETERPPEVIDVEGEDVTGRAAVTTGRKELT